MRHINDYKSKSNDRLHEIFKKSNLKIKKE